MASSLTPKDIKQFIRDLQKLLHEHDIGGLFGAVVTNQSNSVLQICLLTKTLATKADCTTLNELTHSIDLLGDDLVEYVSRIQGRPNGTQKINQTFFGPEPSTN